MRAEDHDLDKKWKTNKLQNRSSLSQPKNL